MKMRKLLPLVLLAVGALFLLSSCDAMLDAIFQNNQISADVAVSAVGGYWDWYHGTSPQVICTLYDSSSKAHTGQYQGVYYDGSLVHYSFTFQKLKDDTYSLAATYSGAYGGLRYSDGFLYDGTTASTLFVPLSNSPFITMPHNNSGDSTGHSMVVKLYVP